MTTDNTVVCAHYRVCGQVQGVFYRASTVTVAVRFALNGWVRNSENGDVEVLACGTASQLDALEKWLWRGPSSAHVSDVRRTPAPLQVYSGFNVRN